jgi:cysteinyl-tRNA synthetase
MRIPAHELFKSDPAYSQWDQDGVPTHDKEGKELSKKQQKYVKGKWED